MLSSGDITYSKFSSRDTDDFEAFVPRHDFPLFVLKLDFSGFSC